VVGRIVSSARELHGKLIDALKLKHPETFLP